MEICLPGSACQEGPLQIARADLKIVVHLDHQVILRKSRQHIRQTRQGLPGQTTIALLHLKPEQIHVRLCLQLQLLLPLTAATLSDEEDEGEEKAGHPQLADVVPLLLVTGASEYQDGHMKQLLFLFFI